jgi:hypothetical protein
VGWRGAVVDTHRDMCGRVRIGELLRFAKAVRHTGEQGTATVEPCCGRQLRTSAVSIKVRPELMTASYASLFSSLPAQRERHTYACEVMRL